MEMIKASLSIQVWVIRHLLHILINSYRHLVFNNNKIDQLVKKCKNIN